MSTGPANSATAYAFELIGVRKAFARNAVLKGVDLRVRHGEIHGLVGQNGAGKSTLLKIGTGVLTADAGVIRIDGEDVHSLSPESARASGIAMVFQELTGLPELTVVDNVFLNSETKVARSFVDSRSETRETRELLRRLGRGSISPQARLRDLSIADQQTVEIAKALRLARRVMILDEPTAALTESDVRGLFDVVRRVAAHGVAVIYVSHRLNEVFEICDNLTVLRNGEVVAACGARDLDVPRLVQLMIGKVGTKPQPGDDASRGQSRVGGRPSALLEVHGLVIGGKVRGVDLSLHPGEITGVAGLTGSGRSTILKCIFGLVKPSSGTLKVGGRAVRVRSSRGAIRRGIFLIPENRRTDGLVLGHSITANIAMPILRKLSPLAFFQRREARQVAMAAVTALSIVCSSSEQAVGELSGGNQQKVVLAKAFASDPSVLLLDEPTFGVDIGAGLEIRRLVREFVGAGHSALWVTSDLRELIDVSDRILVLVGGTITHVVDNAIDQVSEEELVGLMQPTVEV